MIGRWLSGCLVLCAIVGRVCRRPDDLAPPLSAQGAATAVVAIRNGTIITATRGTIANGTVLVRDGKIAAVGTNVSIPAGADVYDATGKFVSPGIIDAHSHIANDAINEGSVSVSSMTGMEDVLDPSDINIYRGLAGGTTAANILHGSANAIGGKTVVIKLRSGKTRASDLMIPGALPGIKFALGENVTRKRGLAPTNPQRFPSTRQGVEYVIRDAFTRAKAYRKDWQDYEAKKKAGQDVLAPRRDLQLDALVEVLEGKRLVHAHSYRADEILMLIRLADEMGFKITTFQHVLEGYKVAKEIAAHNAGASTFSDWWGYKMEAADAIPHNASLMTHKGVLVSINSDDAEQLRRLNMEAAKAIRYGDVSEEQAFAMVTINPAKQLKIDNRVGSIEVGKDADLVVWNHHPLSTAAIVERTYVDGIAYYDREKDLQRIADIQKEKGGRSTTEAAPVGTNGAQAGQRRAGRATGAGGREVRRQGERQRTGLGDHQRAHRHGLGAGDSQGHGRHQGQPDRGRRRQRRHSLGRQADRRRRRDRDAGNDRRQHRHRPQRAGRAQLRRRQRDPAVRPDAADARGLPRRQPRHSGGAHRRHNHGRRPPRRRHHQRRTAGDEPRRLDVGGSDAAAGGRAGAELPRRCRRPRRWWRRRTWRSRAGRGTRSDEDAEPAARTGAGLRASSRRAARSTGPSSRSCRCSIAGRRST